uniref:Uncharacterized protein n=1 Tax=viral metagenome TaxID=1070528 RepID=A0A6H1ZHN2_9ZZZZ
MRVFLDEHDAEALEINNGVIQINFHGNSNDQDGGLFAIYRGTMKVARVADIVRREVYENSNLHS